MKYLFILGRNTKLSIMELFSYFEKEKVKVISHEKRKNSLLVELEKKLEKNIVQILGGIIAIGEVSDLEEVYSELYIFSSANTSPSMWPMPHSVRFIKRKGQLCGCWCFPNALVSDSSLAGDLFSWHLANTLVPFYCVPGIRSAT